jgi:uncharacterized protein YyaL (SSP411 family)
VELQARLAELLGDAGARERATDVVESLAPSVARFPAAFGHLLGTADMLIHGAIEIAIAGDPATPGFAALERTVAEQYIPSLVLAGGNESAGIALLAGRDARDSAATAYVCRNYSCDEPVTAPRRLAEQIEALGV